MIQYHILALVSLVIAAFTTIEAAICYYSSTKGWGEPKLWLMIGVTALCILLYFRLRKLRKKAMMERFQKSPSKKTKK